MDYPQAFDGRYQYPDHITFDKYLNTLLGEPPETNLQPLPQSIWVPFASDPSPTNLLHATHTTHNVPPNDSTSSQQGAIAECLPWYHHYQPEPEPPQSLLILKRPPIYSIPVEILIRICQFVAPPRSRESLYSLSNLTHVCKFWRMALINQSRLWSTIFITKKDHRSFVDACLQRSYPVTLDITMAAKSWGDIHRPACTCDQTVQLRLMPSESKPCEFHFQFELLADVKHSARIRALDIEFDGCWEQTTGKTMLALGSCRFFTSTFPVLATLTWKNEGLSHADHLFSSPPFVPTLTSLTYAGSWNTLLSQVKNLTSLSFTLSNDSGLGSPEINMEAFRLFMVNNRFLESLELSWVRFQGEAKGPPACLFNLKSLTLLPPPNKLSNSIRVPAIQRLTSAEISSKDGQLYSISITGGDFTLTTESFLSGFEESWEDITRYAKPVIRHIRLYDGKETIVHQFSLEGTISLLMMNAQTVEVGLNYLRGWYRNFFQDLEKIGTQLGTVRFEISGDMEPCPEFECVHKDFDCELWDTIEDLVKNRFGQGRPFSVERLVVSEDERENRLQDYVWRCFYATRNIGQFMPPPPAH